jgi:two-component system, OmpR family, response regulator ArlR
MQDNIKILIIEDEKKIARYLELELLHEGYVTECQYSGKPGLDKALSGQYDLVLLDIMLPELNGMEVCRRVRLQNPDLPIIMLTAKDETTSKVMGLDIGANDYITKPFAIEELLARIRAALRKVKSSNMTSGKIQTGDLVIDLDKHAVYRGSTKVELTKREYELLEYLVRNKGMVLTREKILADVWGYDYAGETNVVDVYINYLRNKIDKEHETKLIDTVRGLGYTLMEEP